MTGNPTIDALMRLAALAGGGNQSATPADTGFDAPARTRSRAIFRNRPRSVSNMDSAHEAGSFADTVPMPRPAPIMPAPQANGPQSGAGAPLGAGLMASPIPSPDRLTQPLPSMPPVGSPEMQQPFMAPDFSNSPLQGPVPDLAAIRAARGPGEFDYSWRGDDMAPAPWASNPMEGPMAPPIPRNYSPSELPEFQRPPSRLMSSEGPSLQSQLLRMPDRGTYTPSLRSGIDMGSLTPRDLMPSMSGGAFVPPVPREEMQMDFGGENTTFLDRRTPPEAPEEMYRRLEQEGMGLMDYANPGDQRRGAAKVEAAQRGLGNAAKAAGGVGGLTAEERIAIKQAEPPGLTKGREATAAARAASAERQAAHDLFMENLAVAKLDAGAYDNEVDSTEQMISDLSKEIGSAPRMQKAAMEAQRELLRQDLAELHKKRRAVKVDRPTNGGTTTTPNPVSDAGPLTRADIESLAKEIGQDAWNALTTEEKKAKAREKYPNKKE